MTNDETTPTGHDPDWCDWCAQPMTEGKGCTLKTYDDMEGGPHDRIPHADSEKGQHCFGCEVAPGQLHHPGCDFELCPRCKGRAVFCDCQTVEVAW